jgi:uncharacterized protein with PIN domain
MAQWQESTLDCQDCGDVVRTLSPAEQQEVAERPYDFVVYCRSCRRDRASA